MPTVLHDVVYGGKKSDKGPTLEPLYHETNGFTKKIIVSAGVSWNGKTRIHFIDTTKTKVNSANYIKLLDKKLLPDCRKLYPNGNFILQQDGATSHSSKLTQDYLRKIRKLPS